MAYVTAGGIRLWVEQHGPEDGQPLVLVCGFTAQVVSWDPGFLEALGYAGFRVTIFDNRDVGLSHRFDGVDSNLAEILPQVLALANGAGNSITASGSARPPYELADMARDTLGVMDALGIETAHIVGTSMGGMIAQSVAILAPHRCRTLTSIMSTTSEPEVSMPTPEAQAALFGPPPQTLAEAIESSLAWSAVTGSKSYRDTEAVVRRTTAEFERGLYPEGSARQLAAILGSGDRAAQLADLDVRTLVIHGLDDTLIPPSGGQRTAEVIPSSTLLMLDGMGHDLPRPLWPEIVGAIQHIARPNSRVRSRAANTGHLVV
jgi:pimeloyl-ACP methyl ester carboxylesterase